MQSKYTLNETHLLFVKEHQKYGYKDKSALVRAALENLKNDLEVKALKESADLYSELYEDHEELKELTDTAQTDWPE